MNSFSLDSGSRGQRDAVAPSVDRAHSRTDHLVTATKWCATIVAVLQLLLASLHSWVLIDLHLFGTPITRYAFSFATTFVVVQVAILYFAWTLQRNEQVSLWFLAAVYSLGLSTLGLFDLTNIDLKAWILRPGAALPPNEIMGRDWPLAVAMGSFGLAQLLGILPLLCVIGIFVRRTR